MTTKVLDAQTAYEQARQVQLQEQSRNGAIPLRPLPPWEKLPSEIREAMVHVFYAGQLMRIGPSEVAMLHEGVEWADSVGQFRARRVPKVADRLVG
jgi:hypothetical protein